jgi:hypothetical protein
MFGSIFLEEMDGVFVLFMSGRVEAPPFREYYYICRLTFQMITLMQKHDVNTEKIPRKYRRYTEDIPKI